MEGGERLGVGEDGPVGMGEDGPEVIILHIEDPKNVERRTS
jgi:hypothetical protein